jgi:uncharacterized membrane protein
MTSKASITVLRPREEIERLWGEYRPQFIKAGDAAVRFLDAPGDRGTEIHIELTRSAPPGKLGEIVHRLRGAAPLARAKDDLRRFKQRVETGVIARSEAVPEGESVVRKLRERPAQPLEVDELQKVGA